MKGEIEKFDGRINFCLWQIQVNDILIQSGYTKKKNKDDVSPLPISGNLWRCIHNQGTLSKFGK